MDKSNSTEAGSIDAGRSPSDTSAQPTLSRESTITPTPKPDYQLSRLLSQTSAASSLAPSPQQSREPSPTRPYARTTTSSRASSVNPGTRSRKNSLKHDTSPPRATKTNLPAPLATTSRTLSSSSTPTLLPTSSDLHIKSPVPVKSPTYSDHLKESPRWPVSPRLRSPPPIVNKPNLAPPLRRGDQEPPVISVQRATPSPHPSPQPSAVAPQPEPEPELDDGSLQPGMRTPVRGGNSSTLETVQEVSPLASPRAQEELEEKLEDSIISETSSLIDPSDAAISKSFVTKANLVMNESGSESGSIKASRRSGATSAPPLATRQSSVSTKTGTKSKTGEASLQSMTVETETVASIPQVALTAGLGQQGSNGSLRTKPSSETIRPKKEKEKKKPARKQASVTQGTASTKADIFEAKVASAVEEANSSDSDETFVYDSNPPDGRDRRERYHSRTPSATSMVSQVDRNGMRSIHSVIEGGPGSGPPVTVKKNMKFVNSYNSNGNDSALGDDDGKGTGRSNIGSARGTARHHHHIGRWGRNGGTSHTSLFAEESPFTRNFLTSSQSRQSSRPSSPRVGGARAISANGKRGSSFAGPGYDLDDTTGADDETTPLIQSATIRRPIRTRRGPLSMRSLEQQSYRSPSSVLNRFASCLVLTVMLMLVISGVIGFIFATSQPLTDIELIAIKNVVASEQELMLDLTVKAHNPNVVVVVVDSADIEVFAKSPHAGTDSEWWRRPQDTGTFHKRRGQPGPEAHTQDTFGHGDPPMDDSAPTMRLGSILSLDSPLSFEGSFFHHGISSSTGEVRLRRPGNGTDGGSERWEHILEDEFELILKGVLEYTLPMNGKSRSATISGRTTVRPNAKDDPASQPKLPLNGTAASISF